MFRNSNIFGSCIIHILYTGVPKLKSCILYIYSTNIGTEYFKHGVLKLKNNSSAKRRTHTRPTRRRRTKKINPLAPNDPYSGRTAPLTSKSCILYIYSTNIGTEYFKQGIYSPFFPLQNAICSIIPVLFTFYIQGVPKLKKNNSGAKPLIFMIDCSQTATLESGLQCQSFFPHFLLPYFNSLSASTYSL